jgi:hypothetical protein
MKKSIFILALTLITFFSCRKSNNDANISEGILIGYRSEKCLCCPGNLVKIGLDTLQFEKFPEGSPKITLVYPHKVNLEWKKDTSACIRLNNKLITVSKIDFL